MKFTLSLLALVAGAQAHYTFPALIYGGKTTTAWQYVRQWVGYYTYDPVTSVTSNDIRCNVSPAFASGTLSVTAGSTIGFTVDPDIYHPGPLLAYLAKVPSGSTAANWDGSGAHWFKIYQDQPGGLGTQALTWPSNGDTTVSFTIPKATPNGDYLIRVEHIALHVAQSVGGAQFYISCGQITVTGGGNGNPGPLVAFPGAYSATDPGILINIYYPVVSALKELLSRIHNASY
ncbi:glycoside hydrolase [Xylogone sp. PMI_703]|nr:glycoside hydrolase [Xylogone sp. PMI_703]